MPSENLSLEGVEIRFHKIVSEALQELFEKKQLYQSVNIDRSQIDTLIEGNDPQGYSQLIRRNFAGIVSSPWQFETESNPIDPLRGDKFTTDKYQHIWFRIPTIRIACNFCDGVLPPHNSGFQGEETLVYGVVVGKDKGQVCQVFTFPFQCQNCKGEPIFYLVRREGLKFTVTGRSRFPEINLPKWIPKEESRHFRDAIIGYAAGQTLAALFLLRVFIEQYMRRVTDTTERIRGEELADKYSALLPADFPPRFNSLKEVYEKLSEHLHSADASDTQFEASRKAIEDHFKQLELLPLKKAEQ